MLNIHSKLEGRYKIVKSTDPDCNNVIHDSGWFDNLITNNGLDRLGRDTLNSSAFGVSTDLFGYFHVGAGSTAPTVNDTAMENPVASTGSNFDTITENSSYTAGYASVVFGKQYAQGAAAGNLSEIGLGPSNTNLFSRALIVDGSGNPTTITVLANEFLTVYYELRWLIPQTDQVINFDVLIDGTPTAHQITLRPAYADFSSSLNGWSFDVQYTGNDFVTSTSTQVLTAPTTGPTADQQSMGITYQTYSNGSYQRLATVNAILSKHNYAGGIVTIKFTVGMICYQAQFDPPLQKDNTKTIEFVLGWSWGRA